MSKMQDPNYLRTALEDSRSYANVLELRLVAAQEFLSFLMAAYAALADRGVNYRKLAAFRADPLDDLTGLDGIPLRDRIVGWTGRMRRELDAAVRRASLKVH